MQSVFFSTIQAEWANSAVQKNAIRLYARPVIPSTIGPVGRRRRGTYCGGTGLKVET